MFPKPADIRFSCSCPDYAVLCKHVAAALYGVGARLDTQPELLFRLRNVDETDLIAEAGAAPPSSMGAVSGRILDDSDVAGLFGIDMVPSVAAEEEKATPRRNARDTSKKPPQKSLRPRERRPASAAKANGRAAVETPSVNPGKIPKAAKTRGPEKAPKQKPSSKIGRKTAPMKPAADKPIKWWIKPKPTKPAAPAPGSRAKPARKANTERKY